MITLSRAAYQTQFRFHEFEGLSTDTKPLTIGDSPVHNGSYYYELDTGLVYCFDEENNQWIAQP